MISKIWIQTGLKYYISVKYNFFKNLFIYFIYGCVGSSFLCEGFL